jgi:uncharacterized caspase-like protein
MTTTLHIPELQVTINRDEAGYFSTALIEGLGYAFQTGSPNYASEVLRDFLNSKKTANVRQAVVDSLAKEVIYRLINDFTRDNERDAHVSPSN